MTQVTHPSKEAVRELMTKNWKAGVPLTPEQAKTELGWAMLAAEREAKWPR